MRKDIWIGKKNLRFYYYRYRDSVYYPISFATVTIIACFLLLFYVVIPQVQNWFSIREEVVATRERIHTIQSNIDFMSRIDRTGLDNQLKTASMAVPGEKDFSAVLNALTDAAVHAGIALQDFSFQVGSTSASSNAPSHEELSGVTLSVVIGGKLDGVKKFVRELGKKLPLSEVTTIDGNIQSLTVNIQFYQKNLPHITLHEDTPLVPVSANKAALLDRLSSWKPAAPVVIEAPTASGSASGEVPLF